MGTTMTDRRVVEQRLRDLREAMRTESVSRRTFMQVAGAAALAAGLSHNAAVAAPNPGLFRRSGRGQASANTLVFASEQDISNLDPHTGHDYSITWGQRAVYDSLMRYEGDPPQLKSLLATEVSGSPDATEWTIKLADNATFHDGSKVDAEAIKFNFDRLLKKNLGPAWMFATVMGPDSVSVVDPTTLKVKLLKPFGPFDAVLPWLFVANPKIVQAHDVNGDLGEEWLKDHEAGGGPFTIARWEPGSVYEMQRYPQYWFKPDNGIKPLDKVIWQIVRESATKRIALETGQAQYAFNLTPEDLEGLRAESQFAVNDEPSLTPCAIKLNNKVGPTADIDVRKALALAFDYDAALEAVSGRGSLMEGPLPTTLKPWHKSGLPVLRLDMDKAKAALAASSHKDGFEMEYVYVTGLAEEEQFGLILLQNAADLGITVKMTPLVWPDMVARASKAETAPPAMCVYSGTDYPDPDNFLWQAYYSKQAGFWAAASWYQNPDLDKMLENARATTDQKKRQDLYNQAQQKLVEDAVEIWVYAQTENDAWVKELGKPYDPIMGGDVREIGYTGS
jgi:peptide/nickel transport system substrate-binding protein